MKSTIHLRTIVTESQSEELHKRLGALPFKVKYREEQHGSGLVAFVDCTPAQEKLVCRAIDDIGVSAPPARNEDAA